MADGCRVDEAFIEPISPWENIYEERLNEKLQDELLARLPLRLWWPGSRERTTKASRRLWNETKG